MQKCCTLSSPENIQLSLAHLSCNPSLTGPDRAGKERFWLNHIGTLHQREFYKMFSLPGRRGRGR